MPPSAIRGCNRLRRCAVQVLFEVLNKEVIKNLDGQDDRQSAVQPSLQQGVGGKQLQKPPQCKDSSITENAAFRDGFAAEIFIEKGIQPGTSPLFDPQGRGGIGPFFPGVDGLGESLPEGFPQNIFLNAVANLETVRNAARRLKEMVVQERSPALDGMSQFSAVAKDGQQVRGEHILDPGILHPPHRRPPFGLIPVDPLFEPLQRPASLEPGPMFPVEKPEDESLSPRRQEIDIFRHGDEAECFERLVRLRAPPRLLLPRLAYDLLGQCTFPRLKKDVPKEYFIGPLAGEDNLYVLVSQTGQHEFSDTVEVHKRQLRYPDARLRVLQERFGAALDGVKLCPDLRRHLPGQPVLVECLVLGEGDVECHHLFTVVFGDCGSDDRRIYPGTEVDAHGHVGL